MSTTTVSGGGAGQVLNGVVYQQPIHSTVSVTVHDQFFLRLADGSEREVKVSDFDLGLREGHKVTAVAAFGKGKKTGSWVMFRNHSTGTTVFGDSAIGGTVAHGLWLLTLCAALAFRSYAFAYAVLRDPMSLTAWAFLAAIGFVVGLFVFAPIMLLWGRWRIHRVKKQFQARLVPELDRAASAVGA